MVTYDPQWRATWASNTVISPAQSRFAYPVSNYNPGSYNGRRFFYDGVHIGEDEALSEGTPVYAIGDGRIKYYAARRAGGGNNNAWGQLVVVIEHDLGSVRHFSFTVGNRKTADTRYICSIYGHLRPTQGRNGTGQRTSWQYVNNDYAPYCDQPVRKGDLIGFVNDDANNGDGAEHLHMGIRLSGHSGEWIYYGYQGSSSASKVVNFAAFSEILGQLPR